MIKHICLTILIFLTSSNIFSQGYATEWGAESVSKEGMPPLKVIGESNGDIYLAKGRWAVSGTKALIIIEKYSGEDLHLVYSVEIKMPKTPDGSTTDFENIYMVNGKLLMVTSYFKDIKSFTPEFEYGKYVTQVSNETGLPDKTAIPLYEIRVKTKEISPYFVNVVEAKDHSGLLAFSRTVSEGKLRCQWIDGDLNVTKDIDVAIPFDNFRLTNITPGNGSIFMIVKESLPKNEWYNATTEKHKYHLLSYNIKKNSQKSTDLKIGTKEPVLNIKVDLMKNGLFITGNNVNATMSKSASTGGTFLIKFNPDTHEQSTRFENAMPTAQINSITDKGEHLNPFYNYYTKDIFELPDGGYIITNEHDGGYKLYYQKINASGKLENSSIVDIGTYSSPFCTTILRKNNLIVFCKDVMQDLDPSVKLSKKEATKGIFEEITFEGKGVDSKKLIFEDESDSKDLFPAISYKTEAGKTLIFAQKDKKVQFLIIK